MFGLVLALTQAQAGDLKWKQYVNERFGYLLQYPPTMVQVGQDPTDGAGRAYHTTDDDFSIETGAHFLCITDPNESIVTHWMAETNDLKALITYKRRGDSWYVVSGVTTNGFVFYHKFFTHGKNWASFHIVYPQAKQKNYSPWVLRIEKTFVPFLNGQNDQYDRHD